MRADAWWDYVQEIAGDTSQEQIGRAGGVSGATVNRWRTSQPKPESVVAFAHGYNRPVLEAFVAAGFLTPDDIGVPIPEATARSIPDDELIAEVARRIKRGGDSNDRDMRAAAGGGTEESVPVADRPKRRKRTDSRGYYTADDTSRQGRH